MAQRKQTATMVLIGLISVLIGFISGYLMGFRFGVNLNKGHVAELSSPQTQLANPLSPALELEYAEIIKELNCVCGCKMELQPCTCSEKKGSQEIRGFVQLLVQQGLPRPEITNRLIEKYSEAVLIKKT